MGFETKLYMSFSGVAQGSKIGPALFRIFMNDVLDLFNSRAFLYADDLKLSNCISTITDYFVLQTDLYRFVCAWR